MKCLLVVFFIFIFCEIRFLYAETWRFTSLEWPPYSTENSEAENSFVNKFKAILDGENIDICIEYYPWLRAQNIAGNNNYTGYFPAWPEEVKPGFIASDPVEISKIGVFIRNDFSIFFKNMDDLFKNTKIGLISTYVYSEKINEMVKKYKKNVFFVPDEKALVKMLSKGRFDAAITDYSVIYHYAYIFGINNIATLKEELYKKPLVVAFKNDEENRKRLILFNHLLKRMSDVKKFKVNVKNGGAE